MSQAPWAKVWWDWYVSRSHLGMSGVALALGAPLMLICRESSDRHSDAHSDGDCDATGGAASDAVRIVHKNGRPMTAATLAPIVRFTVEQVQAALDELVDAETLKLNADGVYSFPNFWRYQESASAARMRKLRGNKARHSDAHSDSKRDGSSDSKRTEDRGQRDPSPNGEGGAPPEPKAKKTKSKPAAVQALLDALRHVLGGNAPALSLSLERKAATRVSDWVKAEGGTLEDAARLLAASWAARGNGNAWKLCDVPFRPATGRLGAFPANQNGRLPRTRGTTAEDFADEPDLEEQLKGLSHG